MSQVTTLLSFVLLHRVYMKKTHTYFSIQNKLHWDIYICFCAVVQFLKNCQNFLFLELVSFIIYNFLDLSDIRKVEHFNFIFHLGKRKSGEYGVNKGL